MIKEDYRKQRKHNPNQNNGGFFFSGLAIIPSEDAEPDTQNIKNLTRENLDYFICKFKTRWQGLGSKIPREKWLVVPYSLRMVNLRSDNLGVIEENLKTTEILEIHFSPLITSSLEK